jgi:hypothetical protein
MASLKDPRPSNALQRIRSPATETSVPAAHFTAGGASAEPGAGVATSWRTLKGGFLKREMQQLLHLCHTNNIYMYIIYIYIYMYIIYILICI